MFYRILFTRVCFIVFIYMIYVLILSKFHISFFTFKRLNITFTFRLNYLIIDSISLLNLKLNKNLCRGNLPAIATQTLLYVSHQIRQNFISYNLTFSTLMRMHISRWMKIPTTNGVKVNSLRFFISYVYKSRCNFSFLGY